MTIVGVRVWFLIHIDNWFFKVFILKMVTFPFYSRTKIAIFYKKRNRLSFFSYICSKDFECSILTKDTALLKNTDDESYGTLKKTFCSLLVYLLFNHCGLMFNATQRTIFNMKSIRILTGTAILMMFSLLAGCQEEEFNTGVDSLKPVPEDFAYDAGSSSDNVLAVSWNPANAINAGATGVTVQISKTTDAWDLYDSKTSKTVLFEEEDGVHDAASFTGLKKYDKYYVRARSIYKNSVFSDWVYLTYNNEPGRIEVGYGFVDNKVRLEVTPLAAKFTATWNEIEIAEKYVLEYKESSAASWTSIELYETSCTVDKIKGETKYDVRVKFVSGGVDSDYSDIVTITTFAKPPFPKEIGDAEEFMDMISGTDIAVAEPDCMIYLTADIDLAGKTLPAGAKFVGTLDGKGHKIKNLTSSTPIFEEIASVVDLTIDASCKFTASAPVFGAVAVKSTGLFNNVVNEAAVSYSAADLKDVVLVGGIVGKAYGPMTNCVNKGAVSVTTAGVMDAPGVGGLAGILAAQMTGCTNEGAVLLSATCCADPINVENITSKCRPAIGGLVGFGQEFGMTNCTNNGTVTLVNTAIDQLKATAQRQQLGGIVGAPDGVVEGCVNNGTVEASLLSSAGAAYSSQECIIHAAGIGGGDYYVGQDNTQYINCTNNGAINVNLDASKSNSAIGGIVGWPNKEKAISVAMTKGCKNTGTITLSGHGKARVGGIMGGTGDIIDCENTGEVKVLSALENVCAVGCIAGFHSQGHVLSGCKVKGTATASCTVMGIGGLVGNMGNVDGTIGEDCVINCIINGGTETNAGMAVGFFNGTSKTIYVGTANSPVKIAGGSLNGTAITADNYTSYIWGSGNASEANHIANVVFGE